MVAEPSRTEDVESIRAVASGDRQALGRLYDAHGPVMLGLGRRILGSQREAEDILHDVFVEVWKRAGDYDPKRSSVRTWLLIRMRSRCLDRLRSPGVSRGESLSGREERTLGPQSGPGADPERVTEGARLGPMLSALTPPQRQVILLGYFEGLSESEIAARLGIPLGTVKSRVAAALSSLRKRVGATP